MSTDYVWIIGGGQLQVPAVEAARSLGLGVIVSDRNPSAPAMQMADVRLAIDTYDVAGHVNAAETVARLRHIVGVFTEGADVEVTVSAVAEALSLPGISMEAATNCNDKTEMRRRFAEIGADMPQVKWAEVADVPSAIDEARYIGYPLMVKAADNCASRGVRRVATADELPEAVWYAIENSRSRTALLEEFLEGFQQSVEILFDAGGVCTWLNIVDRVFSGTMEIGHLNPTGLVAEERAALYRLAELAAGACGVRFGAFKADTIWTNAGPRILEVTARLSGGYDCQYTTPAATGRNFVRAAMSLAVGRPFDPDDLVYKWNRQAAAWAAFPKPGKVKRIDPPAYSEDVQEFIRVKAGDTIPEYRHNAERPGFVIVTADGYNKCIARAKLAAENLAGRIVTE